MAADVAGTLGQRNDPGSWPFFACLYSSSCHDGKFSKVPLQNRTWGTGTPTGSATSNAQGPELDLPYMAHQYEGCARPLGGIPSGR
jgi:hypothetical protein